jgi:hypothetical protein
MTHSSFYADGENYDTSDVTSNDTTGSSAPSQAPSSFYPAGNVYNELPAADSILATVEGHANEAASSAAGAAASAAAAAATLSSKLSDPTNFEWSGVGGSSNRTRTNRDRWSDHIELEEFKAYGDGVNGDYSAMMRAQDYLKRNGANGPGGTIHLRYDKRYLMETTPTLTRAVSVEGGFRNPANMMDVATNALHYDTQGGLVVPSGQVGLILDSSCSLTNTLVMRAGMSGPAADSSAFSGLGVQLANGANGCLVDSCMFLGLDRAILGSGGAQHRLKNLFIDCQNGIALSSSFDVCWIEDVHCWPLLNDLLGTQAEQAVKSQRSGVGLLLSGGVDWHEVRNFFTFTYDIGVQVHSCQLRAPIQSHHMTTTR